MEIGQHRYPSRIRTICVGRAKEIGEGFRVTLFKATPPITPPVTPLVTPLANTATHLGDKLLHLAPDHSALRTSSPSPTPHSSFRTPHFLLISLASLLP